jgi:hypothetical protein
MLRGIARICDTAGFPIISYYILLIVDFGPAFTLNHKPVKCPFGVLLMV